MRSINFENIIRKHFGGVNREGLGFLESEIKNLAAELEQLTVNYEKVLTLTDDDLKPGITVVDTAFEPGEVSVNQLDLVSHFNLKSRSIIHDNAIIVYNGKHGKRVFKFGPRNHELKYYKISENNWIDLNK